MGRADALWLKNYSSLALNCNVVVVESLALHFPLAQRMKIQSCRILCNDIVASLTCLEWEKIQAKADFNLYYYKQLDCRLAICLNESPDPWIQISYKLLFGDNVIGFVIWPYLNAYQKDKRHRHADWNQWFRLMPTLAATGRGTVDDFWKDFMASIH